MSVAHDMDGLSWLVVHLYGEVVEGSFHGWFSVAGDEVFWFDHADEVSEVFSS